MALSRVIFVSAVLAPVHWVCSQQLRGEQQVTEQGPDDAARHENVADGSEDRYTESREGPDVAVLPQMSAGERALMDGTSDRGGRIDMIWPGSAYAGVLDGGIWQAAKFDHGYTVDSILGSSGGAASAFLCLVDEAHGTDQYLTTYKNVYSKYKQAKAAGLGGWSKTTSGCNTDNSDDDACWWYYNYKQVLDSSAFSNVRNKLKISMYCKKTQLTVLYNFKSTEEVAQALAAAGNGGLGYFKVDSLDDWCYDYDTSAQGYGFPSKFNPQRLPVYYYNNGPLTSASSVFCPDWTSIALEGYKCTDDAIRLGRKHWDNKNYLWRPGEYSSISNDFFYSFGPATWLER